MLYLWCVLLVIGNTFWLALGLFALPGNWLIVISTCLFGWWQWDQKVFSVYTLLAITILAIAGEVIEFLGGMGSARRAGASWKGSIGAIVGAITGAIAGTFLLPIPVLGTLVGACIGAGLGAWGLELRAGKQLKESVNCGVAAGVGQFFGITAKFFIGLLIWLIVAVSAFWA